MYGGAYFMAPSPVANPSGPRQLNSISEDDQSGGGDESKLTSYRSSKLEGAKKNRSRIRQQQHLKTPEIHNSVEMFERHTVPRKH